MSKIKYSKKFVTKQEGLLPRTYIIYKSFHEDYDTFYTWFNRSGIILEKEFRDMSIHCIAFKTDNDESKFLKIFGENIQ